MQRLKSLITSMHLCYDLSTTLSHWPPFEGCPQKIPILAFGGFLNNLIWSLIGSFLVPTFLFSFVSQKFFPRHPPLPRLLPLVPVVQVPPPALQDGDVRRQVDERVPERLPGHPEGQEAQIRHLQNRRRRNLPRQGENDQSMAFVASVALVVAFLAFTKSFPLGR